MPLKEITKEERLNELEARCYTPAQMKHFDGVEWEKWEFKSTATAWPFVSTLFDRDLETVYHLNA